jgi:hypothetical protein
LAYTKTFGEIIFSNQVQLSLSHTENFIIASCNINQNFDPPPSGIVPMENANARFSDTAVPKVSF